jgi:hypothetical protein
VDYTASEFSVKMSQKNRQGTKSCLEIQARVSYETSFDSKQPKLEPKLVLTLSETRRLVRLFRLNIETGSFSVSIEPKQTENNRNKKKKSVKVEKCLICNLAYYFGH